MQISSTTGGQWEVSPDDVNTGTMEESKDHRTGDYRSYPCQQYEVPQIGHMLKAGRAAGIREKR